MTLKHLVFALASFFLPQGREGDNVLIADGSRNYLYVCPRVRPPHRSRPRFLPQGGDDDDTLTATGTVIRLEGNAGAGDSCTLDGDRKFQGSGPGFDPYFGCE